MTVQKSTIQFDGTAEVVVKGKMGGRTVEYRGEVSSIAVNIDDGIDKDSLLGSYRMSDPIVWRKEETTYSFTFKTVGGRAITAKIGKKPVKHKVRTYGPALASDTAAIEKCRTECGAPDGAKHYYAGDDIVFTWTEEV